MHYVYTIARTFPYWALALAFIVGELGVFYRRRHNNKQFICWAGVVFILILVILWFYNRGDMYSDRWIRSLSR